MNGSRRAGLLPILSVLYGAACLAHTGKAASPPPRLEFKLVADYSDALDPVREVLPACALEKGRFSPVVPDHGCCWAPEPVMPAARIVPGTGGPAPEKGYPIYVLAGSRRELQNSIEGQLRPLVGGQFEIQMGEGATGEGVLEKRYFRAYLLEPTARITSRHIVDARVETDKHRPEVPVVNFTLTPEGGRLMEELTSRNVNRRLAVVLDGKVETTPYIQSTIRTTGQISLGRFGDYARIRREASDLAGKLTADSPGSPAAGSGTSRDPGTPSPGSVPDTQ